MYLRDFTFGGFRFMCLIVPEMVILDVTRLRDDTYWAPEILTVIDHMMRDAQDEFYRRDK